MTPPSSRDAEVEALNRFPNVRLDEARAWCEAGRLGAIDRDNYFQVEMFRIAYLAVLKEIDRRNRMT